MTEGQRVANWITEMIARDDVAGSLSKLVCTHLVGGNKLGDEIRAVKVPPSPSEEWIERAAERLVEQAHSEATTLASGVQRYAIRAFFSGAEKNSAGRLVITCAAGEAEGKGLTTESPDAEGLVSSAMRHVEFFARLAGSQHAGDVQDLRQEVRELRKENSDLRAERFKAIRAMEELYSAAAERDIERRSANAKAKLIEDAGEKFSLMIPMAINHMAGKKLLPEAAPATLLLKSFADSVSADQFAQLGTVLRGDQIAALLHLMKAASGSQPKADDPPATPPNGAHS